MKEPILNDNLQEKNSIDNFCIEDALFNNVEFTNYYNYTEIINSKIQNCNFEKAVFQGLDMTNCIIKLSNLANQSLMNHSYQQIIFDNCNLIGINFTDSYLENILFKNCNLTYSNFSNTNLKNIIFDNCNLKSSSFNSVKWKELTLDNCDLSDSEFNKTSLKNLDISNCIINNINIDITKLKGLTVSYEQAISLSLLLGIKIK